MLSDSLDRVRSYSLGPNCLHGRGDFVRGDYVLDVKFIGGGGGGVYPSCKIHGGGNYVHVLTYTKISQGGVLPGGGGGGGG